MIFRSRTPDVAIPDVPYAGFVLQHARDRDDRPVLVDGPSGRALTLGQVAAGVRRVAAALARRGLAKGARDGSTSTGARSASCPSSTSTGWSCS